MPTTGARQASSRRRDQFAIDHTGYYSVVRLLARTPHQAKFQRTHGLLNHIESGIISVSATDLFGVEIPRRTRRRIFVIKFTTGAGSGP